LDQLLALVALPHLGRQEHHAHAIRALGGQLDASGLRLAAQERVGHLHQDARTVAGERVAAAGAAVGEIAQHLEPLLDDAVRLLALHVHDEADAAGVVLDARVTQPPRGSTIGVHDASRWARRRCPLRSPTRRARLPCATGGRSSGWSAIRLLSACVESTTVVSVRVTPSSERIWVIRRSSVDVFAVFTLRRSVYSPVTWWHSSTPSSEASRRSRPPILSGWLAMTPMNAVTSSPSSRASRAA